MTRPSPATFPFRSQICLQQIGNGTAPSIHPALTQARTAAQTLQLSLTLRDLSAWNSSGCSARFIAGRNTLVFNAFSSEYIAHLLQARGRLKNEPSSPLSLTRRADLLELDLPEPDLTVYEAKADDR